MSKETRKGLMFQVGILAIAGMITKIIGMLYRSPLTAIIGDEGNGIYGGAYNIYTIVLLISAYSIPSAMSKVISGKLAVKEYRNAHRIFKCALVYVAIVGGIGSLLLFFGADLLAGEPVQAPVIRFFSPTIFLFGFLGVLRGYSQAHKNMVPTSISQLFEQLLNAGVSVGGAYALTSLVGTEDMSKRAQYGAIGSSLGTGAGVLIALLFMWFVYHVNKRGIHRRIDRDTHEEISNKEAFGLILTVVTPFILSTFIYNLSASVNSTLFYKILTIVKGMEFKDARILYGVFNGKAWNISNLPIALSSAAAAAMIPEISMSFAKGKKQEGCATVSRVIKIMLMISIPCAVGLFALARPVTMILYPQADTLKKASYLLMALAITVVFYSISTVTNAVLQSIGKLQAPVINATVALAIQSGALALLLLYTNLNEYALAIAAILYSLTMCILNNFVMSSSIRVTYDFRKTYILPCISALVMGIVAFCTHLVFEKLFIMLFSNVVKPEVIEELGGFPRKMLYFSNLAATMIAVLVAMFVYFAVLIKSGGASEDDIKRFPKGAKIAQILKKIRIL